MERVAYLSLGSNLGNREALLKDAIQLIAKRCGDFICCGKIYETPALDFETKDFFLNTCIKINTALLPEDLLENLEQIEKELGRTRKSTNEYESRLIDIDIIMIDDLVLNGDKLKLPHPKFRERLFVLQPLNDIDGGIYDPITKKSVSELLSSCVDESQITVYENAFLTNE